MTATAYQVFADKVLKAAAKGDVDKVNDLAEQLWAKARMEGMADLLIDLWDADEISEDGVEFAVENNGAADPRK